MKIEMKWKNTRKNQQPNILYKKQGSAEPEEIKQYLMKKGI